jgi:hypothetical protein
MSGRASLKINSNPTNRAALSLGAMHRRWFLPISTFFTM